MLARLEAAVRVVSSNQQLQVHAWVSSLNRNTVTCKNNTDANTAKGKSGRVKRSTSLEKKLSFSISYLCKRGEMEV